MKNSYLLIMLFFSPFSTIAQYATQHSANDQALIDLNQVIFQEHILNHSTDSLLVNAAKDYWLITPVGKLESKDQVINGVNELEVSSLKVITTNIITKGTTSILIGKLELLGTFHGKALPPTIQYMSVFVLENGKWYLQARSLTPVLGK